MFNIQMPLRNHEEEQVRKRKYTLLTKNTQEIGTRNPFLYILLSSFKVPKEKEP